ncbi:MAG: COG2426 family protein [bacterium]
MLNQLYFHLPPLMEAAANRPFIWHEHMTKIIITALLSMVPMFEGRYAVTVMVGTGMPPVFAYILAVVASYLPVPFILLLLRPVLDWFYTLPIKPVRWFAAWLERRAARKRAAMHDKRGGDTSDMAETLALYLFVALPVPGTGVWMGSAIATLFNMPILRSAITILLGNMTACLITTLITTGAIALI